MSGDIQQKNLSNLKQVSLILIVKSFVKIGFGFEGVFEFFLCVFFLYVYALFFDNQDV